MGGRTNGMSEISLRNPQTHTPLSGGLLSKCFLAVPAELHAGFCVVDWRVALVKNWHPFLIIFDICGIPVLLQALVGLVCEFF